MPTSPLSSKARRTPRIALILLAAGFFLGVTLLRGGSLVRQRSRTLAAAERNAANLALIVSEYLREAFEATDTALQSLVLLGRDFGGSSAPADRWQPLLSSVHSSLPGIGSLTVVDAAGIIRHSTIPAIVGQSRRDEYVLRRLAVEPRDILVADTPFRGRINQRLMIPLGRKLTTGDGRFDGAIVATLIPAELRDFFRAVDVGERGTIWLFHPAGLLLFREPSDDDPLGENASANPIFLAARGSAESGALRGPIANGGPPLLTSYRTMRDPPLVVAVSLDQDEVLAEWRRELVFSAAAVGTIGLFLFLGTTFLIRQLDARAVAEDALERSRRLEALGQLTGGVAHDFNNLLTVILGNAELARLLLAPAADPRIADMLEQIEGASLRAAELTRRLLTFARRQPVKLEPIDVNALVQALHPMLGRLLGEQITVEVRVAEAPCIALVDRVLAETALVNLCVNARDAMPKGGLLLIETSCAEFEKTDARQSPELGPGRFVVVSVSDNGVGMSPETLAHLFEPFFTTKDVGRGTGLGLSMVYGFVRQAGGQVRVYSELGRGTTVKLFFPELASGEAASRPAEPAGRPRGGGETILFVEDEKALRILGRRLLTALGYRVVVAEDGADALERARAEPRLDLLLTDVILPHGMNGKELAAELQQLRPGLPVLFVSGYSEEILSRDGSPGTAVRLLAKPFTRQALAAAVREALDARSNSSAAEE